MTTPNTAPSLEQMQAAELMALQGFWTQIETMRRTNPDSLAVDNAIIQTGNVLSSQQPNRADPLFDIMVHATEVGALRNPGLRQQRLQPLLSTLQRTSPDSSRFSVYGQLMHTDIQMAAQPGGREAVSGKLSAEVYDLTLRFKQGDIASEDVLPSVAMVCFGAASAAPETGLLPWLQTEMQSILSSAREQLKPSEG